MRGDLLFYSDFPFGFHNTEAEEKMSRFAARGWNVSYVEQLGIRNPRPRHVLRALKRSNGPEREAPFEVVSPKLLAPRRAPVVGSVNRRWLGRQLRRHVSDPAEAVLWIRFPTPEIVPLAVGSPWRIVVYEAVDDHAAGPGMDDRLRALFAEAEERLLARADVVFAWSEPIRASLAVRHPNVHLATAAVDLEELEPVARVAGQDRTAVFTGEMGFRFDEQLAADVAGKLSDWTFLLAGPAGPEAEEALGGHRNVVLTGRYDHHELPRLLARGRVALVPYRQNEFTDTLVPVKLVEYLAAGRPVVSTPMRAAEGFADTVSFASGPDAFAEAVRSVGEDSEEARRRRVERVRAYSWERRIDEMEAAIEAAEQHG